MCKYLQTLFDEWQQSFERRMIGAAQQFKDRAFGGAKFDTDSFHAFERGAFINFAARGNGINRSENVVPAFAQIQGALQNADVCFQPAQ